MTKVKSKWVDGNLVFYNYAGQSVATFDAEGNLITNKGATGEIPVGDVTITVQNGFITGWSTKAEQPTEGETDTALVEHRSRRRKAIPDEE